MIRFWLMVGFFLCWGGYSGQAAALAQAEPVAIQGQIDLRHWPLHTQGPMALNGQWLFHWDTPTSPPLEIKVPGRWEALKGLPMWKGHTGKGFYRLKVLLSPQDVGQVLRLNTDFIGTAFRCWTPEQTLGQSGFSLDTPAMATRVNTFVPFVVGTAVLDLTCEVSNQGFNRGGLIEPLTIGRANHIEKGLYKKKVFEALAEGIVLFLGMYHISLFLLRPGNRMSLWFACTSLSALVYYDFVGPHLLETLFNLTDFNLSLRILRLGLYLATMTFCLYFKALFPDEAHTGWIRALVWSVAPLVVATLVLPTAWHSPTIVIFWLIHLMQLFFWGFITLKACLNRRSGARLFVLGTLSYQVLAINDILYISKWVPVGELVIYGYVLFCLSQALLLAQRFSQAYAESQHLRLALAENNQQLESRVIERTREIEVQSLEIKSLSQFKDTMTQTLIHDLKNPLGVILGQTTLNSEELKQVKNAAFKMQQLVFNALDIQRFKEARIQLDLQNHSLNALLDEAWNELLFYAQKQGVCLRKNLQASQQLYCDGPLIQRVFVNLLSNALRHSPGQSEISVDVQARGNGIEILLCDQGSGIPADSLPLLFTPYAAHQLHSHQAKPRANMPESTGLGLPFCKQAITAHQAEIELKNRARGGVCVHLFFPQQTFAKPAPQTSQSDQNQHLLTLTTEAQQALRPFIDRLLACEVYEISTIREIIQEIEGTIKTTSNPIHDWITELNAVCDRFDQTAYLAHLHRLL